MDLRAITGEQRRSCYLGAYLLANSPALSIHFQDNARVPAVIRPFLRRPPLNFESARGGTMEYFDGMGECIKKAISGHLGPPRRGKPIVRQYCASDRRSVPNLARRTQVFASRSPHFRLPDVAVIISPAAYTLRPIRAFSSSRHPLAECTCRIRRTGTPSSRCFYYFAFFCRKEWLGKLMLV